MSYKKQKACISSRENAHNDTDRQVSTAYYCVIEELDAEHHEALATSPACQSDKGWGVRKGVFQSELIRLFGLPISGEPPSIEFLIYDL